MTLDQIKERLAAANFGPLSVATSHDRKWALVLEHGGTADERRVALCVDDDEADALAHAPEDIARLLAIAERIEQLRDTWDMLARNANDEAARDLLPAVVSDLTKALEAKP